MPPAVCFADGNVMGVVGSGPGWLRRRSALCDSFTALSASSTAQREKPSDNHCNMPSFFVVLTHGSFVILCQRPLGRQLLARRCPLPADRSFLHRVDLDDITLVPEVTQTSADQRRRQRRVERLLDVDDLHDVGQVAAPHRPLVRQHPEDVEVERVRLPVLGLEQAGRATLSVGAVLALLDPRHQCSLFTSSRSRRSTWPSARLWTLTASRATIIGSETPPLVVRGWPIAESRADASSPAGPISCRPRISRSMLTSLSGYACQKRPKPWITQALNDPLRPRNASLSSARVGCRQLSRISPPGIW